MVTAGTLESWVIKQLHLVDLDTCLIPLSSAKSNVHDSISKSQLVNGCETPYDSYDTKKEGMLNINMPQTST